MGEDDFYFISRIWKKHATKSPWPFFSIMPVTTALSVHPPFPSESQLQAMVARFWHFQESRVEWAGHILDMNVPVFFPPQLSLTINLF